MWQVSFVGQTEEAARESARKGGYADKVAVVKTSFKANSKVQHAPQHSFHPIKIESCRALPQAQPIVAFAAVRSGLLFVSIHSLRQVVWLEAAVLRELVLAF